MATGVLTLLPVDAELDLSSGDRDFSLVSSLKLVLLELSGLSFEESVLLLLDFSWLCNNLELGESAPIWLHVWARSAKGLFLASN